MVLNTDLVQNSKLRKLCFILIGLQICYCFNALWLIEYFSLIVKTNLIITILSCFSNFIKREQCFISIGHKGPNLLCL